MSKNILIIAGEASGDIHATKLVNDVHRLNPNINFFGIGGTNMRQAGVNVLIDLARLAVMGLDVFTRLPEIFFARKMIRSILINTPPNLVILVDYPGFNLHIAKLAKKAGVKVLYYISPKIWASRQYRVKIMRDYVDKIAVIFPFEIDFYKQFNLPVNFVGNPLVTNAIPRLPRQKAYEKFGLNPKNKIIGLFPGSRQSELKRLLPIMLKAAKLLQNTFTDAQFVLPLASSLSENDLDPYLENYRQLNLKIIKTFTHTNLPSSRDLITSSLSSDIRADSSIKSRDNEGIPNIYDLINVCDAIIAASGTVTLEIAIINTPLVIIYKVFPPYFPIKKIIQVKHIGLCNIIAGKEIVKELLQQHTNPKEIYTEINRILSDDIYRYKMQHELQQIKHLLLHEKTEDLAELVLGMLSK
jgi:lipid-A-disaccharide synthase